MADTDKKFLDDDGVSQFAEETKNYVDNKVSQLDDKYIRSDDTTIIRLRNQNEINLQEDHNNAWFGYRDGKVNNWRFGNGTEGGLADVYANDYYLGDEKLSDTFIRVDDTTIVKLVNDNEINLQEDHNNAWFGYRGGKVTNWKFGDGTEGGLADVYVKDLYLGDQKLSDLLGDKANDDGVVHKTGDETITGLKSFYDVGRYYIDSVTKSTNFLNFKVLNIELNSETNLPTKNYTFSQNITSSNPALYLGNYYSITAQGLTGTDVRNYKYNSSKDWAGISIRYALNDETYISVKCNRFDPATNNTTTLGAVSNKWKDVNTVLLNGKTPAYDADVVHNSGNETIAGVKTFTSSVVLDGNGRLYQAYATDYTKGGIPSSAIYQGLRFYDDQKTSTVANHITGAFEIQYGTDGYNKAYIGCRNYSDTTQLNYNVGLRVPNDSTRSIDFYPSVDNKINLGTSNYKWADINTVLLNGKTPAYDADVVHKTGNETITGVKTFASNITIQGGKKVVCNTDNSFLELNGGTTWGKGGSIVLSGQDRASYTNSVLIVSKNDTDTFIIEYQNGILKPRQGDNYLGTTASKWKDVNTELLNGKTPDLIEEQGDGYIRYSNGIQICWANIPLHNLVQSVGYSYACNFPKTFIAAPSVTVNYSSAYSTDTGIAAEDIGTAGCTIWVKNTKLSVADFNINYMAIGKWK